MKSVTTITIDTEVIYQFRNAVGNGNVSREIESLMKARLDIIDTTPEGQSLVASNKKITEELQKVEQEKAAFISKAEYLKKKKKQLEAEIEKEKKRYTYL